MNKNLLSLVLLFLFFSCDNYEELNTPISSSKSNEISSTIKSEETSDQQQTNLLIAKLDIYSYVFGRVLLKHYIPTNILLGQQDENHIININDVLQNYPEVKQAFSEELFYFSIINGLGQWTGGNPIGTAGGLQPPIGDKSFYNYSYLQNVTNSIFNELDSNNYTDCLELKIVKPIDIPTSVYDILSHSLQSFEEVYLYTVPHPLSMDNFGNGYQLYTNSDGQDQGLNVSFDQNFVDTLNNNVIVVRPVRNQTCSYDNILVIDFTYFLND